MTSWSRSFIWPFQTTQNFRIKTNQNKRQFCKSSLISGGFKFCCDVLSKSFNVIGTFKKLQHLVFKKHSDWSIISNWLGSNVCTVAPFWPEKSKSLMTVPLKIYTFLYPIQTGQAAGMGICPQSSYVLFCY